MLGDILWGGLALVAVVLGSLSFVVAWKLAVATDRESIRRLKESVDARDARGLNWLKRGWARWKNYVSGSGRIPATAVPGSYKSGIAIDGRNAEGLSGEATANPELTDQAVGG